MSIAELRRCHPTWVWTARRKGFGWEYEGSQGKTRVKVYATSQLSGWSEDDYTTVWRVYDGKVSETFSWWSFFTDDP